MASVIQQIFNRYRIQPLLELTKTRQPTRQGYYSCQQTNIYQRISQNDDSRPRFEPSCRIAQDRHHIVTQLTDDDASTRLDTKSRRNSSTITQHDPED